MDTEPRIPFPGAEGGKDFAPLLSVVIPTCNRLDILRQCLECLAAQTLPRDRFEVLVVDDGSTDGTPEFLATHVAPFSMRTFCQPSRGGPARARNVGIRAARGEYVLFLNDDAMLEPNGLRGHLETHLALPELRISVLGRFELPRAFRSRLWGFTLTRSDLVFEYGSLRQDVLYGGGHYYTCNVSTPRQALFDAGLFDEAFTGELWGAEDIEIGHRLARLDPPVGVLFREGCAAEHRHDLSVTDFGRMFRVRGGGAVRMFARHDDMVVHYRHIRRADVSYWRGLPAAVVGRVENLQELLRATEGMAPPMAAPGSPEAEFPEHGLRERDLPELHRDCLSLWRMREDRLLPLIDARIAEVRQTLAMLRKGRCSMQQAARGIYPACLYLRWHHDTVGVCAAQDIVRIMRRGERDEAASPADPPTSPASAASPIFPVRPPGADARAAGAADSAGGDPALRLAEARESGQKGFLFSVVTAAYNAAPWLDEMFTSLERQTLDFAANIQVVLVDDGSTDDTPAVAGRWARRYPSSVVVVRKENGGPASARNAGLAHATGDWVGFIDADDMVAPDYFETVRNFLTASCYDGPVVACNTRLYEDGTGRIGDAHPLAYKFESTRVADLMAEPECIQLFVNACLVRRDVLEGSARRFDERIRPTFEDAHFLNLLLLHARDFRVAFVKEAHYLYRRRGAGSGLVEGGWQSPAKYREQILYGYLDIVQQYRRVLGEVPAFVQNLVLYESHWYMVRLLDGGVAGVLDADGWNTFFDLMALLFRNVDARQVLLSRLPSLELRTRIAMLGTFKGAGFTSAPFVLTDVAPGGGQAQLVHWTTCGPGDGDDADTGKADGAMEQGAPAYALRNAEGQAVDMRWARTCVHYLGGRALLREQRFWVDLPQGQPVCSEVDGERPGVLCRGALLETLDRDAVCERFYLPISALGGQQQAILAMAAEPGAARYRGGWVFMDRVHKADDNAEHLCRWVLEHRPDLPVHFVLDRRSADWTRLEREGFPLLPYHSREHFLALANAEWLVSSHVDPPVADPMGMRDLTGLPPYKLAFLQHGVIKDDLSRWLNQIRLDFMVASVRLEYASLLGGRYKLTEREVALTGLPRHDTLLRKAATRRPGRTVLFCPTWREHLRLGGPDVYEAHASGLRPGEARHFRQSDFFRAWSAVTSSQSLARMARDRGWKLLFLPHPELVRFLPLFPRSDAFTFLDWAELGSVQDFLVGCAVAVTDYSSLAFEFGYMGRPVAYYQFPEKPDIYATHVWQKGYFDCAAHGLGPVVRTTGELEAWLDDTMRHGGRRQELYERRADAFFTLRDGQNCRRTCEAILARSAQT